MDQQSSAMCNNKTSDVQHGPRDRPLCLAHPLIFHIPDPVTDPRPTPCTAVLYTKTVPNAQMGNLYSFLVEKWDA